MSLCFYFFADSLNKILCVCLRTLRVSKLKEGSKKYNIICMKPAKCLGLCSLALQGHCVQKERLFMLNAGSQPCLRHQRKTPLRQKIIYQIRDFKTLRRSQGDYTELW